jgi:hypothetical protein
LAAATANIAYSATISATGGSGSYTFAVSSGSLPSWLALNTSTGVLSGTPTTTGTSSFTITAADSANASLTGAKAYTLTVNAASSLTVSPTSLPPATATSAYSATLSATGGSGTYTFAVSAGSLPSWLTLNASTGVLSGTPTSTGTSSFTIKATDSTSSGLTGTKVYTLTVNAAGSLTVSPATLPVATANSVYSATLSATGGSGSYTFVVNSGSLPSGLALTGSTGVLSGTPTAAGTFSFTVTANDNNTSGLSGSRSYTFTVSAATQAFPNNSNPPSLPAPTGTVINVSTVSQLQAAVANLQSSQTIMIAAGTYNLTGTLYVPQGLTNIASRGATGKVSDVVIKGDAVINATAPYNGSAIWGSGSGISGAIPFGMWIGNVQGVTIGDLTLENYVDDAIILNAGVQSPLIHNVVMLDTGEQLFKSNPDGSGGGVNNGIVEYCTIGYSVAAPNNYTNGVDVHTVQNWIIRNNVFKNIYTTNPLTTLGPGARVGPAVLIWNGSKNCTTENNAFFNCQREIAYGLSDPSTITDDNSGGLIANNFIYRSGSQHGDVAIGVWNSPNTEVAYNTVVLNGDYVNAVEYRFATTTGVKVLYNLTDAAVVSRDGATATVTGNVTSAQSSWFVNESIGNLNLTTAATAAIGHGVYLPEVATDYSGQARPSGSSTDVGAAKYTASSPGSLTLTPATLPAATANTAYSATASAAGGSGSYTFAVNSGSLPSWLTLNASTGVLSGTPTSTGASSFTITATDSTNSSLTGAKAYTLTVNAASSLTVSPGTLSAGTLNSPYSATLGATGGSGSYTFAVTAGSLPSWLALNASTGVLSGTPTSTGTSSFTITATDSTNSSLTGAKAYTLTVNAASSLTVAPATLPAATANSVYSATVSATGGSGSYTFAVSSGSLPSWLSLNASTGALSGTPSSTGTSSFTIKATDTTNSGLTGTRAYTLTVNPASSLTLNPATLPGATANSGYSATLSATGGSGTYSFAVTAGSLPAGLSLNASTGVLGGTPTTAGNASFTITATDSANSSLQGSRAYAVTVASSGFNSSPTITTSYLTIPNFGAKPTIFSVASGNWSSPATWSLGRVPSAGDIVDINPGTTVTYDVNDSSAAAALNTVEIQATGTLTFATNINTQVVVGNFLVLDGGSLVVGTAASPIAANVHANINLGNQAFNTATDPQHFGDGLIVLGNVTMHGVTKTPYVSLAQEAHKGDTVLHLAAPVSGWQAGDDPLLPDTRQLFQGTNTGSSYQPQWERVTIQSVSADGLTVFLTTALKYDHLGARDANGVLDYLPHVMNDSRNIMVQSQSMTGIRGYTLFTGRANVDIEYAGFCELGRTTNNPTSSSNLGDRYAMTVLDLIGPSTAQANGYQFTLLGNEVDNDGDGNASNPSNIQWGIAVNNSFYGLIQYNSVFAVAGVGIGVEDGAASYNVFDHNFVANVTGSGVRLDDQLQGDGYWFHNPNNHVTNNIAADINASGGDVYSYGFSVDATTSDSIAVGTVAVAAYQGADPSQPGQSSSINMNAAPLLEFSGNEVYGATSRGFATWWLGTQFETPQGSAGTLKNSVVWNQFNAGYFTYETNNLVIDGFVARGDASQLSNPYISTVGLYFGDYMTRNAVVKNLDIQDEHTGIVVPSNVGRGGASDVVTFTIANAYLRNVTNIDVPLLMSSNGGGGLSSRTVIIQNVQYAPPVASIPSGQQVWNIEMDTDQSGSSNFYNTTSAMVVDVYNYNDVTGDNFQAFYSTNHPAGATQRSGVDGYVEPI